MIASSSPRREPIILTVQQGRDLLAAAQSSPLFGYPHLALTVGMRPGELAGLRWADVDLETGEVTIARTLMPLSGRDLGDALTKNHRITTHPLPRITLDALRSHRQDQLTWRAMAGENWVDNDLVFPNRAGRPMPLEIARRQLMVSGMAANLPRIYAHCLRTTGFAWLLMEIGPSAIFQFRMDRLSGTISFPPGTRRAALLRAARTMDRLLE